MWQFNKKIVVFTILLDVLIAFESVIGICIFGPVYNFFGSEVVDLRWMLIFIALGVVGAVILTVALRRNINPLRAVVSFVPPLCVSLYWFFGYVGRPNPGLDGIVFLGLPVLTFLGGIALGIYMRLARGRLIEADAE